MDGQWHVVMAMAAFMYCRLQSREMKGSLFSNKVAASWVCVNEEGENKDHKE